MKSIHHPAHTRGHAAHAWLESYHSFSFADYHDPERMHFGVLRVLNDDRVAPGKGFDTHRHDNMEIISIPTFGDLQHKDSMGNTTVIKEGDIQVMSAGTGVYHSEYNLNADKEVRFFQIWIIPKERGITPRYDQAAIADLLLPDTLSTILSPETEGPGVSIHQDAWMHLGQLSAGTRLSHQLNSEQNGLYVFMIEGRAEVGGHSLDRRDGLALSETRTVPIEALSDCRILTIEVPMSLPRIGS